MEDYHLRLSEARKKLNLTIDDVSLKTKIRPHILATLEEGNWTFLPPVYIISFIKTYSTFLKIPQRFIDQHIEDVRKLTKYEKPEPPKLAEAKTEDTQKDLFSIFNLKKRKLPKINQSNLVNYLLYSAIGLALLALLWFAFFMNGSGSRTSFQGESGTAKPDTAMINGNDKTLSKLYDNQDSIIFEAKGIDTAWLRINIDGTESQQYLVVPKFEKKWTAKKFVVLSLGNAGAVEFRRDGVLLPPFGTKGNVIRNVKITKDQVVSSSNPWANPKDSATKAIKKPKKQIKKEEPPRLLEPAEYQKSYNPFEKKK